MLYPLLVEKYRGIMAAYWLSSGITLSPAELGKATIYFSLHGSSEDDQ